MKLDKLIPPIDLFSKLMYSAIENKQVFCPQLNSINAISVQQSKVRFGQNFFQHGWVY